MNNLSSVVSLHIGSEPGVFDFYGPGGPSPDLRRTFIDPAAFETIRARLECKVRNSRPSNRAQYEETWEPAEGQKLLVTCEGALAMIVRAYKHWPCYVRPDDPFPYQLTLQVI